MKRTLLLCTLLLALFAASALLAAPATPAPQTADLAQLHEAIFQPAPAETLSPLDGALPMVTTRCVPTINVCVNKACQCDVLCGSCGVASFTCNQSTGDSTCKCKTC